MLSIQRTFISIPVSILHKSLQQSQVPIHHQHDIEKESLTTYYNTKLLYLLRFERWPEFFYIYESASILNHGTNDVTHIIAAHAYIMAYKNLSKANEALSKVPNNPAKRLCTSIFECYSELKTLKLEPASPDWAVLVNLTAVVAAGKPAQNKWKKLSENPRTAWHLALRPWKYPRHVIEIKEDYKFKQRLGK